MIFPLEVRILEIYVGFVQNEIEDRTNDQEAYFRERKKIGEVTAKTNRKWARKLHC